MSCSRDLFFTNGAWKTSLARGKNGCCNEDIGARVSMRPADEEKLLQSPREVKDAFAETKDLVPHVFFPRPLLHSTS